MADINYDLLRRLGLLPSEFGTGGELPSFPTINVGPRFGPQLEDSMSPPIGNLPPALQSLVPEAQRGVPDRTMNMPPASAGQSQAPLDAPTQPTQPGQTTQRFPWVTETPPATPFDAQGKPNPPVRTLGDVPMITQGRFSTINAGDNEVPNQAANFANPASETATFTRANPADTQNWIANKLKEQTEQRAASERRAVVEEKLKGYQEADAARQREYRQNLENQSRGQEAEAIRSLAQTNPAALLEYMAKKRAASAAESRGMEGGNADAQAFRQVVQERGLPGALDWLRQNEANKQKLSQTPEDAAALANATLPAKLALKNAGGKGVEWTPEAIDTAAKMYMQTGTLPALGMSGGPARAAIFNRVAELSEATGTTPEDIATQGASFAANKAGLTKTSTSAGAIMPFLNLTRSNLEIVRSMIPKLELTDYPILNKAKLAYMRSTGDPRVSDFEAAIRTTLDEFTRIVTTAGASGITAQAERDAWDSKFHAAQSPAQLEAVVKFMDEDLTRRFSGFETERGAGIARLRGNVAPTGGGWAIKRRGQ